MFNTIVGEADWMNADDLYESAEETTATWEMRRISTDTDVWMFIAMTYLNLC